MHGHNLSIRMLHLMQTPPDSIRPFLQVWTVILKNKSQCGKAAALPEEPKQGVPKAYLERLSGKGNDAQHLCLAPMVSMSVLSATHNRACVCHISSPIPNAAGLSVHGHVRYRSHASSAALQVAKHVSQND